MDRRLFLKRASGLFIACAPAIIHPEKALAQLSGGAGGFPGPGTVHSTGGALGLQTSCTGFWEMQTTGWADATGNGTTLTGNGSPSTGTGIVGNAVSLNGSSQWLSAASNTNIVTANGSFSAQCWVNLNSNTGVEDFIFNKGTTGFQNGEWTFGTTFTTGNVWCAQVSNTGGTYTILAAPASGTGLYASSVWRHLVLTFNATGTAATFYVNGVSAATGTPGTANSTTNNLQVGRFGASGNFANGLIDQCGFWKGRVLSAGDVTALYNGGNGLSWAAML